ncbi:CapA family protein [Pseudochelatococcus sp. B33]
MKSASFVGAGDLLIGRSDPLHLMRHVADILRSADITYLNLEGPITDRGEKNPALAGIANAIRSVPATASALAQMGVNVVSLANNHTMDYGIEGLEQSLDLLDASGIAYCGGGRNLARARKPVVLEAGGLRVAFLSYTSVCPPVYAATETGHGAAFVRIKTMYEGNVRLMLQPGSPMGIRTTAVPEDLARVREEIRDARQRADALIVAWHWGVSERWGKLADYQQECGRAAIDAGADMVLGNHAHMLQGVEFHAGKPIFHSLGNFAFDMRHHYFRPENLIVKCDVTPEGLKNIRMVPVLNNDDLEPQIATGRDGLRIAFLMEELSAGLNAQLHYDHEEITAPPLGG